MQDEHWRLAVEATGLGTWELDGATGTRRWSPEFKAICGLPPDAEPTTELFSGLIHPDDSARVNEAYAAAYKPGSDGRYEAEFRIRRADTGEERWVLARGRVELDSAGRTVWATGLLLDTTARRHAERALLESEERYRLAVLSFQGAVFETDLRTGYAYRAPQAYAMLGVDPAAGEPTREWWQARIHPDDRAGFLHAVDAAIAGGADGVDRQYRIRHESGEWVWVWHRGTTVRDCEGSALRLTGAFLDITAQKRAEQALQARSLELETVLDTVPAAVWFSHDPEMRDVTRNRYAADLTEMPWPQPLGSNDTPGRTAVFKDGRLVERRDLPLERAFRGDELSGEEFVLGSAAAEPRTLLVNARGLRDGAGAVVGAVAVALDITDRKRAEEHRRLLVNELNHRVKNTLATVQSLATQTLRRHEAEREVTEALTGRIMSLSRAHDLLTRESWEGATIPDIVSQVAELHGGREPARFDVGGPHIRVEPRTALHLAMALHELATNALKYGALSNESGMVEITWAAIGGPAAKPRSLRLRWSERGGPPVTPPRRRGLGSRLLERGLAAEPGEAAALNFAAGGVVYDLTLHLAGTGDP